VDVQFGRNYVPTWAFDHIKYFNGGSEIQLHLDKYTGKHSLAKIPNFHCHTFEFKLCVHVFEHCFSYVKSKI